MIMNDEEKGFVIKDKRHFTPEGEPIKPEAEQPKEGTPKEEAPQKHEAGEQEETRGSAHLPEVTFATFIFSLVSSAMVHLGELDDPTSGVKNENYDLAKQTIDIIGMLREKTQGNLAKEEQQMIDSVLYDLRMRYVRSKK
jgi:hypothetical protein